MKVLIIEDDRDIVEVISLTFEMRRPDVQLVSTHLGEKGVELVESENPDVVILDLGLPDMSGFDVLKQIRLFSDVPIIILTVRSEEADIVRGLEWGADDYLAKPFRQMELLSRIRAVTRRRVSLADRTPLVCGQLRFDPTMLELFKGENEIKITATEGHILHNLMRNAGQVVAYSSLAESVWGEHYSDAAASVKVYIRRLREKIEVDPSEPQIILNKAGIGYLLIKPD
ncbi:response regulator transcription factor [Chloroflexota bacterium]